jgi:hypothetical protein
MSDGENDDNCHSGKEVVSPARNLCQECKIETSIYQCPACRIRTCSLPCCQGHKKRTDCTGKRKRSEFLPLCRMNDDSLRSDYFFLEEVLTQMPRARKVACIEHGSVVGSGGSGGDNHHHPSRQRRQEQRHRNPSTSTNKKSRRLVQQAQRRNITLQLLPSFMERHQTNTSWYCGPRDMITWRVEFIFIPTGITRSFQISENEQNLWHYIQQQHTSESHPMTEIQDNKEYKLFLKRFPSPANQPRYIELNATTTTTTTTTTTSLRTALEGLTIIEYPTIFCVPNVAEHLKDFPTGTQLIVEEANVF